MNTKTTHPYQRAHRLRATGREIRHEFGSDAALEYEVVSPDDHYAYADGELCMLPDGSYAYAYDMAGMTGLFRDAVVMDAGENEIRRRTAPADLDGLTAPERRGQPLSAVGSGLVGWLR